MGGPSEKYVSPHLFSIAKYQSCVSPFFPQILTVMSDRTDEFRDLWSLVFTSYKHEIPSHLIYHFLGTGAFWDFCTSISKHRILGNLC